MFSKQIIPISKAVISIYVEISLHVIKEREWFYVFLSLGFVAFLTDGFFLMLEKCLCLSYSLSGL